MIKLPNQGISKSSPSFLMGLNIELELWNKHNARLEHLSHSKECGHNGLFDCYRIQRRTTFWVWSLVIFFAAAVNIYLEWILQGTWSCPVVPPGFKFVTFPPLHHSPTMKQMWTVHHRESASWWFWTTRHGEYTNKHNWSAALCTWGIQNQGIPYLCI